MLLVQDCTRLVCYQVSAEHTNPYSCCLTAWLHDNAAEDPQFLRTYYALPSCYGGSCWRSLGYWTIIQTTLNWREVAALSQSVLPSVAKWLQAAAEAAAKTGSCSRSWSWRSSSCRGSWAARAAAVEHSDKFPHRYQTRSLSALLLLIDIAGNEWIGNSWVLGVKAAYFCFPQAASSCIL